MDAAIYKALSGAVAQMRSLEVAAQDLANVNTSGYKRQHLAFGEVLAKNAPADSRPGGFVAVGEQRTSMAQGAVERTGDPFNLALEGDGYFAIDTARGERYTRNGGFTLRADGTLITAQGEPVLGEGGPLVVTGNIMEVAADGTVRTDTGEIGKLRMVRFVDAKLAEKEGANLFRTDASNLQAGAEARVVQGSLEQSNVSPIDSMVSLITINRQFEAYQRAMKMIDSITEKVIADAAR
jgi:flagellar basal-body rod protein FlgF